MGIVEQVLSSFLSRVNFSESDFDKLHDVLYEAQHPSKQIVKIYWVDQPGGGSNATPQAYQVQFKDVDGNVVAETSLVKGTPQIVALPAGQYQFGINIIETVTNVACGGNGFSVQGSEGYFWQNNGEELGQINDVNGVSDLNKAYMIITWDGGPC